MPEVRRLSGEPIPPALVKKYEGGVGIVLGNGPSILDYDLTDPFFTENVTLGSNAIGKTFTPTFYLVADPVAFKLYRGDIVRAHKAGSHLLLSVAVGRRYLKDVAESEGSGKIFTIMYLATHVQGVPSYKGPVFHGRTSGVLMLNVAYKMGFQTIFMLGVDGYTGAHQTHFYRNKPHAPTIESDSVVRTNLRIINDTLVDEGRGLFDLSMRGLYDWAVPGWWEIPPS